MLRKLAAEKFICDRNMLTFETILGVETISKDAFKGTETVLSCKITGLSEKATVVWKKGGTDQTGMEEGQFSGGSQTSTLTVSNPQEDTDYTCVVTSKQYPASASSTTIASLNTYCKFPLITFHDL